LQRGENLVFTQRIINFTQEGITTGRPRLTASAGRELIRRGLRTIRTESQVSAFR
jgi:hypothetical protein